MYCTTRQSCCKRWQGRKVLSGEHKSERKGTRPSLLKRGYVRELEPATYAPYKSIRLKAKAKVATGWFKFILDNGTGDGFP
jgi:hypothetical protein